MLFEQFIQQPLRRNRRQNSQTAAPPPQQQHMMLSSSPALLSSLSFLLFATILLINLSCTFVTVSAARHHDHLHMKITNLEAKVGSYVVFNCYIDFPYDLPIPYVVHWSKDNKKIFTWYDGQVSANDLYNGRLNLVTNNDEYGRASANLTAIRESDQGLYHCQIVFPNRSPSIRNNGTTYQLSVQGGSLIKIPPMNQTIMEGQTAFFHCVMKFPNISQAQWYKDGVLLQDIPDLMRRSYMGPQGSLSIDPTMMSDYGEYECRVQVGAGGGTAAAAAAAAAAGGGDDDDEEVQSAKAFLNIQYKAKVIYAAPEVYLPYGQPAVLDCHFRSNPPLKNLRWEKDGLLFDSYNVPGVFYKMNGSLFFSKVDESHSGSYTCTPYNDLGTDGPSPVINVIVLRPPIFTVTPKAIYIQKLGDTAHFPCQAIDRDGTNHPSIDWKKKDGTPFDPERFIVEDGNLTITHLIETDRGIFECMATNEAATISAETELMIENISPRPPFNLTGESTETTITIKWLPGYLRPNLEYTVWYRLTDAQEWRTMRVMQKNVMEATIQHLLPGREYEFMVLSQDKYGDGMFSKQLRFSTQPSSKQSADNSDNVALPSDSNPEQQQQTFHHGYQPNHGMASGMRLSPPWNLTAVSNQQGWLVHWEHPQEGLDMLRLYTVYWWKEPEHHLVGTAETFDNFYQLRHFKEDSKFMIQVAAISADGENIKGQEITIEVPSHRKMRALLIGSSVSVAFLLCALIAFLYVKRSCLRHLFTGTVPGGSGDEDDDDVGVEKGYSLDDGGSSDYNNSEKKINNT